MQTFNEIVKKPLAMPMIKLEELHAQVESLLEIVSLPFPLPLPLLALVLSLSKINI